MTEWLDRRGAPGGRGEERVCDGGRDGCGRSPARAGARNVREDEVRQSEEFFQVRTLTARPLDLHPMIRNWC
jgi:hypothetical protein